MEDKDTIVRKNALMVLSHLVLNDMIKLTGFAHTLAKCLEDSEPRIVDFAKLFFSEFHAKGVNNMFVLRKASMVLTIDVVAGTLG